MQTLCSIFDKKTQVFGNPFVCETVDDGKRIFRDLYFGSKDSLLAKYPEDFDLYCIGNYDKHAGRLISKDTPAEYLMSCQDFVKVSSSDAISCEMASQGCSL